MFSIKLSNMHIKTERFIWNLSLFKRLPDTGFNAKNPILFVAFASTLDISEYSLKWTSSFTLHFCSNQVTIVIISEAHSE